MSSGPTTIYRDAGITPGNCSALLKLAPDARLGGRSLPTHPSARLCPLRRVPATSHLAWRVDRRPLDRIKILGGAALHAGLACNGCR